MSIPKLKSIEPSIAKAVVDCNDHREFLGHVFRVASEQLSFFNHTYFCKRAGFSSRNVVRDVIAGRKNLTLSSYLRLQSTLGMSGVIHRFFQLLVAKSHPELERSVDDLTEFSLGRQRALVAKFAEQPPPISTTVWADRTYLDVYASCGNEEIGASFDEIVSRTALTPAATKKIVTALKAQNLLVERGGRFFPQNADAAFENLGAQEFFRSAYFQTLQEISRRQEKLFSQKDTLFFQASLCLNQRDMRDLAQALKTTINAFVDKAMKDDGDAVAKIVVGFYI